MARECVTPAALLNREGGDPRECSQPPLQQSTISSKHSLCDPKPKPTQDKAVSKRGWKGITPIPFLNPDLVTWLVGRALVHSEAQVSNISAQLCKELGLKIQPLGQLLELEGTGVQPSLTSDLWR